MPYLNDGHANAVMQKPDDDAIGIQHHGATRRNVVDLADHLGQVGCRIAQLLGEDHHVPRWIATLAIVPDELEVDRRAIALPTYAHDALALRQQPAQRVERRQKKRCYVNGCLAHGCSLG